MFTLTRTQPRRNGTSACGGSWSTKVTCTADSGVDPKIFVFHAVSDVDGIENDSFSHVASLAEMSDIPADAPDDVQDGGTTRGDTGYIPYYRVSEVELSFPNAVAMEHTWKAIRQEVAKLVKEYESFSRMEVAEEIVI